MHGFFGPIITLVVGAISFFAVKADNPWVDFHLVGGIVVLGGVIWLVLEARYADRYTRGGLRRVSIDDPDNVL